MPRNLTVNQTLQTFSAGLNTEANPLSFPENSLKAVDNVDLFRNGTAKWRRALTFEQDGAYSDFLFMDSELRDNAISTHTWASVDEDDELDYTVVQVGLILYFFRKGLDRLSSAFQGSIDISSLSIDPRATGSVIDAASGKGHLFIVGQWINPAYVSLTDGELTLTEINIRIRDVDGVEDDLEVDERPVTLSKEHEYNLRNQGWPESFRVAFNESGGDGNSFDTDPIAYTFSNVGFYPSNADVIYSAKLSQANRINNIDTYSPWDLNKNVFGNTPAAKGHYILPAFDRNRSDVSGITDLYVPSRDLDRDRPVAVAFYTGRVWYLTSKGRVLYTQILTDIRRAGHCYQEADPTAEQINELVATDGGFIDITGLANGRNLEVVGNQLTVMGSNGSWSISGPGDEGFKPTEQEIRFISNVGSLASESFIEAEGTVFFWSKGGIYALAPNEVTGALEAKNLIEENILSLYLNIPEVAKKYAKGFYVQEDRKIIWLYNDESSFTGTEYRFRYNRALVFDIILNAWYSYTFSASSNFPWIAGVVAKDRVLKGQVDTSNGTPYSTFSPVTQVDYTDYDDIQLKVKLLTFANVQTDDNRLTFSEFSSEDMYDFLSYDGTGKTYESYAETGTTVAESLFADKEISYLYLFMKRTETKWEFDANQLSTNYDRPSGAQMYVKWQWADKNSSNRWSEPQQAYRFTREHFASGEFPEDFDYGFEVVQTIHQIRGKGRALSVRFESEPGKDFHLLGWASPLVLITDRGN